MPYVFPHEQWFVYGVAGLIVALVIVRVAITISRRKPPV